MVSTATQALFPLGRTVATRGVALCMAGDVDIALQVPALMERHQSGDWGDLDDEDKAANVSALAHGDRIVSAYSVTWPGEQRVYVITEADRSLTTVLFPREY